MDLRQRFNSAAGMEPSLTVRSMQNAGWQSGIDEIAQNAGRGGSSMNYVLPRNPMISKKAAYQRLAAQESQAHILTQVLHGIRQSGSTARTARISGLGAVDCAPLMNPGAWAGAQADVHMALTFVAAGSGSNALSKMASTGVGVCFLSMASSVVPTSNDAATGAQIYQALRANGVWGEVGENEGIAILSRFVAAFKLTPSRALELLACARDMDAINGWANYGETWKETACGGAVTWYENPLYLGIGAAALIGAVWFATRKKKAR